MESAVENTTLPTDTLKWMKTNANPKMSLKLMQVCKYFKHQKFPYFVVKNIYGNDLASLYKIPGSNDLRHWYSAAEVPDNLWITESIFSDQVGMTFMSPFFFDPAFIQPNFISQIIPKIVVCDLKELEFHGQDFTLKEFEFLTASGMIHSLSFSSTIISDENGEIVLMEILLNCLPNVESVYFWIRIPSFSSIAEAQKVFLPKLEKFVLRSVSHDFNFEAMFEFMTKHKFADIRLMVSHSSSTFPQMQKLQNYIDELVQAGPTQYPPPCISFPGQSEESKTALMNLYSYFCDDKSDEDDVNEDSDCISDEE